MALPPRLRNLNKPQTLLLLGGAFGFAALAVWLGCSYRLVRDPLTRPPREAEAGFFLTGPWPEGLAKALPDGAANCLKAAYPEGTPLKNAVIFTWRRDGERHWSVRRAEGGPWKLVPRAAAGYGFVAAGGRKEPVRLDLGPNWVAARVGRGFRGLELNPEPDQPNLIRAIPDQAYLYVRDRNPGRAIPAVAEILAQANAHLASPWPELWAALGGEAEAIVAKSQEAGEPFAPFLIAAEPAGTGRSPKQIDALIADVLGQAVPSLKPLKLSDGTQAVELKSSRAETKVERRTIATGTISSYGLPKKPALLTTFEDLGGHFWFSNKAEIIQALLLASPDASLKFPTACAPTQASFQAVYYPSRDSATGSALAGWISPEVMKLDKLIFSLNEAETGLFTTCGYYH